MSFFYQDPLHIFFFLLGITLIAISIIYVVWRLKENRKYQPSRGLTVISAVGFGMLFGSLYSPGAWYPENALIDTLIPIAIVISGIITIDTLIRTTGMKLKVKKIKSTDKL